VTRRLRVALELAVFLAAVVTPLRDAAAQSMADMSGIPLPDGNLPGGTVTVRVVGGSFSEPIVGVDVVLTAADGSERVARTDAEGRATLPGLTAGGQYVASAKVGDAELESQPFSVPPQGGVRLLLSNGGGEGAPAMGPRGSGGKAHAPGEVSGRPQADASLKPGVIAVHLVRGDWKTGVEGAEVHLVGYQSDGTVMRLAKVTGKNGRLRFSGLVPMRAAYFVLAVLQGEGGEDRLQSLPIVLSPQMGTAVTLAGRAIGADPASEPRDDLDRLYIDQEAPPAGPGPGEVVVRLRGEQAAVEGVKEIEILEVGKPEVAAKSPSRPVASGAGVVRGNAFGPMKSKEPAGNLTVMVVRATSDTPPVPDASVELRPGDSDEVTTATTNAEGKAVFQGLEPGKTYRVAAVVQGTRVEAPPVELPAEHGLLLPIGVDWGKDKRFEGRFSSIPAAPDKVYLARATSGGAVYNSPPFQLTPGKGATVAIPIFPHQDIRFHVAGSLDDRFMHFQGMFTVSHGSFVPYDPGPDGFLIPLPKSFVGANVPEEQSRLVKVISGRGLVWKSVIPPGGIQVTAAFTVPVDEGAFDFDMDLPNGAFNSDLRIEHTKGMQVRVGGNLAGEIQTRADGREFYVIPDINLSPNQRLLVKVSGMPHVPRWRRQARLAAGVIALVFLFWALSAVLFRTRRTAEPKSPEEMRERLLDELADLERRKRAGQIAGPRYQRSRDQLVRKLEPLYQRDKTSGGASTEPRTA